uniref:AAA+ ATPase domain-containing protein n=1 Tax=Arcella intermedia TaxID=1963864 RepID=A0A6B2L3G6_9EUKA
MVSGVRWMSTVHSKPPTPPPRTTQPPTPPPTTQSTTESRDVFSLEPAQIVSELDNYIIGQNDAKRTVAIAMRNRWRRNQLKTMNNPIWKEIVPKNILMIGPTGTGKTEIARRMASLTGSPFIKVEATKFTEVGFKGQDVDKIIKDLIHIAVRLVKERDGRKLLKEKVDERILDLLTERLGIKYSREDLRKGLLRGEFENQEVPYLARKDEKISVVKLGDVEFLWDSESTPKHKMIPTKIKDIRTIEEETEYSKIQDDQAIIKQAVLETEQFGIVFIDEIDKITRSHFSSNGDASDEGVQRDLLPLIEGTKIATDFGEIDTSQILFIASGAFHQSKPSDLLAELQGRLPLRVVLNALTEEDFFRILTEPTANIIRQQRALLKTEDIDLRFTMDALLEISKAAFILNQTVENIGARRLFTVLERILEEYSFNTNNWKGSCVIIDAETVQERLKDMSQKQNLKRYIL